MARSDCEWCAGGATGDADSVAIDGCRVVIAGTEPVPDLLVVPRPHLSVLTDLPPDGMATLLAEVAKLTDALRRHGWDDVGIDPETRGGHLLLRISGRPPGGWASGVDRSQLADVLRSVGAE